MSSCGICSANRSSANLIVLRESEFPTNGPGMKIGSYIELSSQWNCSGRLSSQLQIHFKGKHNSFCLPGKQFNDIRKQKHFSCSCRLSEKRPSAFPSRFSSYFREWLSQIFNMNATQEDVSEKATSRTDAQACRFGPVVLDYENKKCTDSISIFNVQQFDYSQYPFSSEDPSGQFFTAQALAEMAITDLVSTIPSISAVQTVPYFDILQSNLTDITKYSTDTKNENSHECLESQIKCVTPDQFASPDALASWLSNRLPSGISHWGTSPGTKRVANLWIELQEGEIMLQDAYPPKRTVHVASVKIKNQAGQMLVEAHQEMADGSIRFRNRPLSEKMRPGENIESACFRGISEELGCQLGAKSRVNILLDSYKRKLEERESLSYPGLLTAYVIHSVEVTVDDLPDTCFYTVENETSDMHVSAGSECTNSKSQHVAIGVKKHFWRWVPQHP